jgi:ATP-binding cassette subfamily C protein CydD
MPLSSSQWLKAQEHLSGPWLRLAVALGVSAGLLVIAQAWLLARTLDAVIFRQADLPQVQHWLWLLLGLFALRALLAWGSEQAAFRAAVGVKLGLRDALFRRAQSLGPVHLGREGSGDLATRLVDGIEALEPYYARFLPAISLMVMVPLSILAFVWPRDWLSGLILLGTAPLIPLFMILIGKGAERLNQRQWRRLARLSAHFLEAIQGLTTLKLFNASRREAELVARISDDYRRSTMAVLRVAFLSSLALEFFATLSIALLAVTVGFRLLWGEMDFLHGFFILLLAPEFYLPLRSMGTHYHARMEAIGAAERLVALVEASATDRQQATALAPDPRQVPIRFEAVEFTYTGGRRALRGLDLEIRPGERLALVGPSGAGKSTLANLLLGFIQPDCGRIRVGDLDLTLVDPDDWRRYLAWIPQRPRLFHGSLLDNIRLGRPGATEAQVRQALMDAGAEDFVDRLPQGLEILVGENGQGLSGGQVQRIALARAFLREASLVVLDEPTASLDRATEARVQQGIGRLAQGRTLVTIAHRLHTVRRADRILVLEEGRVVEQGGHQELARSEGLYRHMLAAFGATP